MPVQNYAGYAAEDHATWEILFRQQMAVLDGRICDEYLDAAAVLQLPAHRIPEFPALNERLARTGSWRVDAVDGMLSAHDYFAMVSEARFPAATHIRGRDELEHSRLPDVFHDIFGHTPLLAHPAYSVFIVRMGRLALDHIADADALASISRVMKWTTEYGLVRTRCGVRAYGAGLISSRLELTHVLGDEVQRRDFDAATAIATAHVTASLQPAYFVIESIDSLPDVATAVATSLVACSADQ
jgi:phenylalanine-4-hydroxylase